MRCGNAVTSLGRHFRRRVGVCLVPMALPFELPDDVARRLTAAAAARGVSPEDVLTEAVEAHVGPGGVHGGRNPFASVGEELRAMVFDGSLRSEIDAIVDDTELSVG